MSPRALFAKKWESHNTKEYSLHQKKGVPAPKMGVQNCKLSVSESTAFRQNINRNCKTTWLLDEEILKKRFKMKVMDRQLNVYWDETKTTTRETHYISRSWTTLRLSPGKNYLVRHIELDSSAQ